MRGTRAPHVKFLLIAFATLAVTVPVFSSFITQEPINQFFVDPYLWGLILISSVLLTIGFWIMETTIGVDESWY